MDFTAYTLLLACGSAFLAALISGWLLQILVSPGVFCALVAADLVVSPLGLIAPWYCTRQRRLVMMPTLNIFVATATTVLVCVTILLMERIIIRGEPLDNLGIDQLARTLVAVSGIAMATSLVIFLLYYSLALESARLRRAYRKFARRWATKPRVVLCNDLLAEAPGECAICLDVLVEPLESLWAPPTSGSTGGFGLLRLPCGHIFHSECADRWIADEDNCPMCRLVVRDLSKCQRLCLRSGAKLQMRADHPPMITLETNIQADVLLTDRMPPAPQLLLEELPPMGDYPPPDKIQRPTGAAPGEEAFHALRDLEPSPPSFGVPVCKAVGLLAERAGRSRFQSLDNDREKFVTV